MTAEAGHAPARVYIDQQGDLHLNGAKLWDASEVDVTASQGTTSTIATLTTTTSTTSKIGIDQLLRLSPKPTDTFAGTMTIDVAYSHHLVVGASGTSATVTFTPSAAGTAGDVLVIQFQTTAAGQVVATYASTFHSSGTQTNAASRFSTIAFVSDGAQWNELFRTTALS